MAEIISSASDVTWISMFDNHLAQYRSASDTLGVCGVSDMFGLDIYPIDWNKNRVYYLPQTEKYIPDIEELYENLVAPNPSGLFGAECQRDWIDDMYYTEQAYQRITGLGRFSPKK